MLSGNLTFDGEYITTSISKQHVDFFCITLIRFMFSFCTRKVKIILGIGGMPDLRIKNPFSV